VSPYLDRLAALSLDERAALRDRIALLRSTARRRLVAYVIPRAGRTVDEIELANFARGELPEYMVPAAFVAVESFPLSATGKIDRAALPDPFVARPARHRGTAPRGALEESLARVWSDVLGLSHVGRDDDFFAHLGGHSLLATRLLAAVRRVVGVQLPVGLLFEAPTVAKLAKAIEQKSAGTFNDAPALERLPRTARPLHIDELDE
jgi:acyl carrier protein